MISPLEPFRVPGAKLVIRSSDLVDFRVHKSVLPMASPIFRDTLSLPQPSDSLSEIVDGLQVPMIQGVVSTRSMPEIRYSIGAVVYPCLGYPGAEAFTAYAITSSKMLIPEMENAAARLTLDHPMTFEMLGERLRFFEGWALRDLANFRKRCRDNVVSCFGSFLKLGRPSFNA